MFKRHAAALDRQLRRKHQNVPCYMPTIRGEQTVVVDVHMFVFNAALQNVGERIVG